MNKSKIDYLQDSILLPATGRVGGTHNIITGCKHGCEYCYARRMVEHGRLKGNKAYPRGFEPTFHPERVDEIGGAPKLIFCNDMGDCGGDWLWHLFGDKNDEPVMSPETIASVMVDFAEMNPRHIILLLTKRPEWYGLVDWPENVWLGITAVSDEDFIEKIWGKIGSAGALAKNFDLAKTHWWVSFEPYLDANPPDLERWWCKYGWFVIGGQSGRNARPVSEATLEWIYDETIHAKRFVKNNAFAKGEEWRDKNGAFMGKPPREYPDAFKVVKS